MKQLWQQLTDFLHQANLIPLVAILSPCYHYLALRSHDPLLMVMPIALFIALLHFKMVQRAVQANHFT